MFFPLMRSISKGFTEYISGNALTPNCFAFPYHAHSLAASRLPCSSMPSLITRFPFMVIRLNGRHFSVSNFSYSSIKPNSLVPASPNFSNSICLPCIQRTSSPLSGTSAIFAFSVKRKKPATPYSRLLSSINRPFLYDQRQGNVCETPM